MPCRQNIFANKLLAAGYVWNGFGKTAGLVQIQELGTLETPIALTNTLNVGLMQDALVEYMVRRCREDGVTMKSINPVVGECNDSRLNDICERAVKEEHLMQAIQSAGEDFPLGAVGAGRGTICHGLKGGIGLGLAGHRAGRQSLHPRPAGAVQPRPDERPDHRRAQYRQGDRRTDQGPEERCSRSATREAS